MNFESTEQIESLNERGEPLESTAEPISDVSENLVDAETTEELHSKIEVLESYSPVEYSECVYDAEVKENIADFLESYEDFRYENWSKLSLEQKQQVLQNAECYIAQIEHRPAKFVQLEQMPKPGVMGYHDEYRNKIALNSDIVGHDGMEAYRKTIETLLHEGRHAYQHYNIEVRMIHESGAEVESWRENYFNSNYGYYHSQGQKIYIPTREGYRTMDDYRLYYYQPVEIDARNFASDVMSRLEAKGIVQSAHYA